MNPMSATIGDMRGPREPLSRPEIGPNTIVINAIDNVCNRARMCCLRFGHNFQVMNSASSPIGASGRMKR